MRVCTTQFLLGNNFAGHGLNDVRPGDKHLRGLIDHDDEVDQGGGVHVAAGAGTHNEGNLGDHARRQGIAIENLGIENDVKAKDVENLLKNKEFLLDVREDYEYQDGHIKGAVNLPLREILSQKDSLPKDRDIYVYCRSAHRSSDAVNFLKSLGFEKVHNIEGGFIDISFNEYHKDKGNLENSIVTNYNFD